jgi:hypothetical protein
MLVKLLVCIGLMGVKMGYVIGRGVGVMILKVD